MRVKYLHRVKNSKKRCKSVRNRKAYKRFLAFKLFAKIVNFEIGEYVEYFTLYYHLTHFAFLFIGREPTT